jgi:hypothetical protein
VGAVHHRGTVDRGGEFGAHQGRLELVDRGFAAQRLREGGCRHGRSLGTHSPAVSHGEPLLDDHANIINNSANPRTMARAMALRERIDATSTHQIARRLALSMELEVK